jgi:glutathione S-transferase
MLFYSPGACSLASHIALEETGQPYRAVEVLLATRQQLTAEYLAVNPRGQVPALIAEGQVLTENTAILTYIGLTNPEVEIFPRETIARAQCISRMAWLSNTVHISQRTKVRPYRFVDDETMHAAVSAKGQTNFWENLREIDTLAAGQNWLMGESYTVADPYSLVLYGWGVRNGLPMHELKNFTRLKHQMLERRAVRTVLEREKSALFAA